MRYQVESTDFDSSYKKLSDAMYYAGLASQEFLYASITCYDELHPVKNYPVLQLFFKGGIMTEIIGDYIDTVFDPTFLTESEKS